MDARGQSARARGMRGVGGRVASAWHGADADLVLTTEVGADEVDGPEAVGRVNGRDVGERGRVHGVVSKGADAHAVRAHVTDRHADVYVLRGGGVGRLRDALDEGVVAGRYLASRVAGVDVEVRAAHAEALADERQNGASTDRALRRKDGAKAGRI
eukprot:scaffold267280_cov30-Tisochrysis_lutea.AAC.14